MKIGLLGAFSQHTPPDLIAAAGRGAEARGFHSIWAPEHVVFFEDHDSRYPYSEDGRIPGNPNGVLEPFTALAYLAATTEQIRLGTGICLVPQRNPVYTAKQVADVDYLSGGRLDFGVGIGWCREEFEALGVPWARRAARTTEYLEVMQTLWTDEVSSYEGEFHTLRPCLQNPKPVQKPHPPVFFGGESEPALARVASHGQGWFGFNLLPADLPPLIERLDTALTKAGRKRDEIEIFASPYTARIDRKALDEYEALGISQVIVPLVARNSDDLARRLDQLAGRYL